MEFDGRYRGVEGLGWAVMALRCFQVRHQKVPEFGRRSRRYSGRMVGQYREKTRRARRYVELARSAGWRGSVVEKVLSLNVS